MKGIHVLLIMLLLVLGTSCGTTNKLMQVQEGMTKQEVTTLFGVPEYRRFDGGIEEWEYQILSVITGDTKVVVITFDRDRVSGMNTFKIPNFRMHPASPSDRH